MTSVERVKKICKARKKAISNLELECGFGNGYINSLKKGSFPDDRVKKIADALGLSVSFLLGLPDECGLNADDWSMMGATFQSERTVRGKSIEESVDGSIVTAQQLSAFETAGDPLTDAQLATICGMIGADPALVFLPWHDRLWPENAKKAPAEDGERQIEDDFTYAAHKYTGKLRKEDKDTIIKMMQTLAAANEGGGSRGEAD